MPPAAAFISPPHAPTAPIRDVSPPPAAAPPPLSPSAAGPGGVPRRLGAYEILGELGQGGMGRVYRARHVRLGTECAVKVLIAGEHASPESIARFRREAALVAGMGKHPHIVAIHDLGDEGALTYYAMELVEGTSLSKAMRERPFTPEEAAALVEKVARAIHFAHRHRVIHRDLKPENVVLRTDGEPQVVDFGLAQDQAADARERRTVRGAPIGTYAYMAPEQGLGDLAAIDARTDVYGIGGILYELLTSIPPHPGEWPRNAEQILRGEVLSPAHGATVASMLIARKVLAGGGG
jgi:serine/threonine-protein kinase